jgi:hypothetical protein
MSMLGQHSLSQHQALSWITPRWHAYLRSMPPQLMAQTIERARKLASEHPRSYLAEHLTTLYGERI